MGKARFVVAGVLVVAAVLYLIVSSTSSTAHYFLTVEELNAGGDDFADRSVTVSGAVLGDTIVYDLSLPRVSFTIVQIPGDPKEVAAAGGLATVLHEAVTNPDAPQLDVVYDDVKPDLLQHEAQAILRGRLGDDGRFHADDLLLKCPTRYEEDVPDQAGGV